MADQSAPARRREDDDEYRGGGRDSVPRSIPAAFSRSGAGDSALRSRTISGRAEIPNVALLTDDDLDAALPHILRTLNISLLFYSFVGTVVAWHGGDWTVWLDPVRLLTLQSLAGLVQQAGCTLVQWFNRYNKQGALYRTAYVLDFVPTLISLQPLLLLFFQFLLIDSLHWPVPTVPMLAYGTMTDGSLLTVLALLVGVKLADQIVVRPEDALIARTR